MLKCKIISLRCVIKFLYIVQPCHYNCCTNRQHVSKAIMVLNYCHDIFLCLLNKTVLQKALNIKISLSKTLLRSSWLVFRLRHCSNVFCFNHVPWWPEWPSTSYITSFSHNPLSGPHYQTIRIYPFQKWLHCTISIIALIAPYFLHLMLVWLCRRGHISA